MTGASSKINSNKEKIIKTKISANRILFTDKITINSSIKTSSIGIGYNVGYKSQGTNSVAIGFNVGSKSQGINSVAIGSSVGQMSQGNNSVAIGISAGFTSQGNNSIAIGNSAGYNNQKKESVAIGSYAGEFTQENNSVAIGNGAASVHQKINSVAIGSNAGVLQQATNSVAIGNNAGNLNQNQRSVAIGNNAGNKYQGSYSVAIGNNAGQKQQHSESIILSSSKTNPITSSNDSGFYVRPINSKKGEIINNLSNLYYDSKSGEISTINNGFFVNSIKSNILNANTYPMRYDPEGEIFYDINLKVTVLSEIQLSNNGLLHEMYVDDNKDIRFIYDINKIPLKIEYE